MLQLRLPNIFKSIITQLVSLVVLLVMFVGVIGVNAQDSGADVQASNLNFLKLICYSEFHQF